MKATEFSKVMLNASISLWISFCHSIVGCSDGSGPGPWKCWKQQLKAWRGSGTSVLLCSWRLPCYKALFFSCRSLSHWQSLLSKVLGKLHPWEGAGSHRGAAGTLLTWVNGSHCMQVAVVPAVSHLSSCISFLCALSLALTVGQTAVPHCGVEFCFLANPTRKAVCAVYPVSVCPGPMYGVSICILYCRFGTSSLASLCQDHHTIKGELLKAAKFRDCLFVFISRAQLGVADDEAA